MHNIAERGKQASVDGFAHEHIAAGILMKKYQNVSLVDLPLSPYDIIIVRKTADNSEDIIRAQVKTATQSVPFTGGGRGGVDRTYKSDVKTYQILRCQNPLALAGGCRHRPIELDQRSILKKDLTF